MEQVNNNIRCCATCSYWLGERRPDRLGFVVVASKMNRGQCARHALSEHYIRQACFICRDYSKWAVLK